MRTEKKQSLVSRAGLLLKRAGLSSAVEDGDLVAIKLHFGEEGNTGFVHPVFLREVVRRVRDEGGKPFLTDSNTLYRGKRFNAVDHLACAVHNGFSYSTVDAPIIIADGLDGREGVDVGIDGFDHFDTVRIGAAAVHADAMVVVTHVKGHEATGFGGALKNVGMGLGCRSAKQRMHADFEPHPSAEKCTACGRCVQWCPVDAMTIGPDNVAVVDYELCYGCGECVAACPYGAIAISWKTDAASIQEKIVEHVAGAVACKDGQGRLPVVRHQRLAGLRLLALLRRAGRVRSRRAGVDRHRRDRSGRLRPGDRCRGPCGLSRRRDDRRRGQVHRDHRHRWHARARVCRGARTRVTLLRPQDGFLAAREPAFGQGRA